LARNRKTALEDWKKCLKLLKLKQVPILYLDANEPVASKAEKIIHFVNSIEKNISPYSYQGIKNSI